MNAIKHRLGHAVITSLKLRTTRARWVRADIVYGRTRALIQDIVPLELLARTDNILVAQGFPRHDVVVVLTTVIGLVFGAPSALKVCAACLP